MMDKKFIVIVSIIIVCFVLWYINKETDKQDKKEGFEGDDKSNVINDISNETNKNLSQSLVNNSASVLANSTNQYPTVNPNETTNDTEDLVDVFKYSQGTADVDMPQPSPLGQQHQVASAMGNNTDNMNLTNDLGALIKSGKILTSDQLLPYDEIINEHNQFKIPTTYMDSNLAANGVDKFGVDTIGSSKRNASQDIRGNIPCPKVNLSPFHNSTIDPDYNLKGLISC